MLEGREILLAVLICLTAAAESSVVETCDGPILGKVVRYNNIFYKSYQGIRYAQPPTGGLRFKPPVPVSPWTGVLDARQHGAVCPQAPGRYERSQMSEDCLFLNVYTPTTADRLPVLLWVHGGEFRYLSGNEDIYGPQFLMEYGLILVTLNYRLGPLGFLSLKIDDASGNAGLKDVTLALQWTKRNIASFGGDPDSITIGGNSAGSAIAHYLMLSTKANELFKRVILHSGSALGYRFFNKDPIHYAFSLGLQLGTDTDDKNILLDQLLQADPFEIINATDAMGASDDRKAFRPFSPFVPTAEVYSPHAFITEEPIDIIWRGIPQNCPVLVGFNNDEGISQLQTIRNNPKSSDELNENFERCIPTDIGYPSGSIESRILAQKIRQFYFKNKNITENTISNYIKLITDTQFSHSIDFWIRLHKCDASSADVFYYKFKFEGDLNWYKRRNQIEYPGTAHSDDLGYLFHTTVTEPYIDNISIDTRTMLNNMLTTTTNFVKYGSPTPDAHLGVIWEPMKLPQGNYLTLEPTLSNSATPPIRARTKFWEDIYLEYYYKQSFNYRLNCSISRDIFDRQNFPFENQVST